MDDLLVCFPNDDRQNFAFCRLKTMRIKLKCNRSSQGIKKHVYNIFGTSLIKTQTTPPPSFYCCATMNINVLVAFFMGKVTKKVREFYLS